MDSARLHRIVAGFAAQRVLVIGDLMLDEFVWGKVSRISPEAPVPVVKVTSESYYPGGAANVARNVREFTAATAVMGIIGTDAPRRPAAGAAGGRRYRHLRGGAGPWLSYHRQDTHHRAQSAGGAGGPGTRDAFDGGARPDGHCGASTVRMGEVDAIIVADYGKGYLSQPLADYICRAACEQGRILTVDPHPHTSLCWRNATAVKPNRWEAFSAAGVTPSDGSEQPESDSSPARSRAAPAVSLESQEPVDHAGGTGHAAVGGRRGSVSYSHASQGRFRRVGRRRYRACRLHAGAGIRSRTRRGRGPGQPRERHCRGQAGHRDRHDQRITGGI